YKAAEDCQWCFQCVTEVAQGVPGALEGVIGVRQQTIDLRHQRSQFMRGLDVQLPALALLQLCNLLASAFQWAQGELHCVALQQQEHQQNQADEPQSCEAHLAKAVENRRVVLRHMDNDLLTVALIAGAVRKQPLALRPFDQPWGQSINVWPFRGGVPEGA